MKKIGIGIGIFVFLFVLLGCVRTWYLESKPEQQVFQHGKVPKGMPDGFYRGSVGNWKLPWQGKTFDRKNHTGANVVFWSGKKRERFPFKTYIGKGLRDTNVSVIKIDYSSSDLFVRLITDEIVEVAPGKFLGKAHLTLIPGLPFTVAYFELRK